MNGSRSPVTSRLRRLRALARQSLAADRRWEVLMEAGADPGIARLCDLYGSDKGSLGAGPRPYPWAPHSYADVYALLFRPLRRHVRWVLECGIGTNAAGAPSSMGIRGRPGASLRVWRDYFPAARIIGVDIDGDILFSEDRIETNQMDQTSAASIAAFLARIPAEAVFDIIIDDGLHAFRAGVSLFQGVSGRLAPDGIYVIEDVSPRLAARYRAWFRDHQPGFAVRYAALHRRGQPLADNGLMIVTRADHPPQ